MSEYFVVPMQLDVLCLNRTLLGRDGVRWWNFNYASLNRFLSPEPAAYDAAVRCTQAGAYLHFILPSALRTSLYEDGSFPLLPNRWLIIRTDQTTGAEKCWVLESDCPASALTADQAGKGSAYPLDEKVRKAFMESLDPYRNTAYIHGGTPKEPVCYTNIGVAFPLEGWQEREPDLMFLTALSQGNENFTGYYPHNSQVLSFCDTLDGIDSAKLSYTVVGWYSNGQADVIRPGAYVRTDSVKEVLKQLDWRADRQPQVEAASLFCAKVENVLWEREGEVPQSDPLTELVQTKALNLAVGDQPLDALSALAAINLGDNPQKQQVIEFMEALYLDQPELLDHPAGERILRDSLKANGFERTPGDCVFRLAKEKKDGQEASLTAKEAAFLKELNETQTQYEYTLRLFSSLQWELHAAWWKYGRLSQIKINHTGITKQEVEPLLDPDQKGSLMNRALAALEELDSLKSKLPSFSDDPKVQERNFQEFLSRKGIDGCVLKSETVNDFYMALNPAVLINGLSPSPDLELSGGLDIYGLDSLLDALPKDPYEWAAGCHLVCGVQKAVAYLKADGKLCVKDWSQPFAPVFFEWNMRYSHIPWILDGKENWYFDGDDYKLREDYRVTEENSCTYGGIAPLSPHMNEIMKVRLQRLERDRGYSKKADRWVQQVSGWNFMTQELLGMREQLAQRDKRAFRSPQENELKMLLGFPDSVPFARNDVISPFFGICSGVVAFKDIMLYDKFGRVLYLIGSNDGAGVHLADNFPFVLSDRILAASGKNRRLSVSMALPPRLLQPARIKLGEQQKADVCGWVAVNYVNRSIAIYDEDATALGELLLLAGADGKKVCLREYPGSGSGGQKCMNATLKAMVDAWEALKPEEWNQFLGTLEKTMLSFPPASSQGLSFLTGRLLAVAKLDLTLEFLGEPYTDQAWDKTVDRLVPDYLDFSFSVRLGESVMPEDGLAGYYRDGDFTSFYSSVYPTEGAGYVRQIGPKGQPGGNYIRLSPGKKETVVMLMDPDLHVHVYSGILPVAKAGLREQEFPKKEAFLSIGPLRMAHKSNTVSGKICGLAEKMGQQLRASWWEKNWEACGEKSNDQKSNIEEKQEEMTWTVREGFLAVRKDETYE